MTSFFFSLFDKYSIKTYGLIQAITVRKHNKNQYELISGERRLRASIIAGLKKIPAFINQYKKFLMCISYLQLDLEENKSNQEKVQFKLD